MQRRAILLARGSLISAVAIEAIANAVPPLTL